MSDELNHDKLNDDDFKPPEDKGTNGRGHTNNGKLPDLVRAMNNAFGGPTGFANEVKSVYDAAPEGSHVKAAVMRSLLNMHEEAYRLDPGGDDLDQLPLEKLVELEEAIIKVMVFKDPEKWLPVIQWAIEAKKDEKGRRAVFEEVDRLDDFVSGLVGT